MRLNSVEQVLKQLETQPGWEKFRQYRQLLKCWEQTVDRHTAQHTRPLHINRQILYVATNSAARAQELSFQRYALLKRINQHLTLRIEDIRFSSSQWHQKTYELQTQPPLFTIADFQEKSDRQTTRADVIKSELQKLTSLRNQIKTNISDSLELPERRKTDKIESIDMSAQNRAKNAALRWLKSTEERTASASTSFCPKCQAIASNKELARWGFCHHCVAQQWNKEYRPPTFPEPK
ncbi:MAG: DUF721 domain-containing protein [Cyanobacteria bacterium J06600_6]